MANKEKPKRVSPADVLTELENQGRATRGEIAAALDCSEGTVSRKVAQLIKDGEDIGFDRNGLFIQHKGDGQTQDGAELARAWTNRIVNSMVMWAHRGNSHRPIAVEARRRFAQELTQEERKLLKGQLLLIGRVVDAVDLDEELQE